MNIIENKDKLVPKYAIGVEHDGKKHLILFEKKETADFLKEVFDGYNKV